MFLFWFGCFIFDGRCFFLLGFFFVFGLFWFLLLAGIRVGRDEDWNPVVILIVGISVMTLLFAALFRAVRMAQEARAESDLVEYG